MSYNYVIDTSIWIEYFAGSSKGIKIKEIIEKEVIATSIFAIAEISDKYEREGMQSEKVISFIQSKAVIIPLTVELCVSAAKIKKKYRKIKEKFGIADAIHLSTAQDLKATFLTADNDFKEIENVILV